MLWITYSCPSLCKQVNVEHFCADSQKWRPALLNRSHMSLGSVWWLCTRCTGRHTVGGTHEVCRLMRGQRVAQAQSCSWLHPSSIFSHLLLDFALQKILLSLLYGTALNGVSSSAWKSAVISHLKPLLSLDLLFLLSSLSFPLLQEKESALWPFCHLCVLLICCNLMLVPAVLLVSLSTSSYSVLIAKYFSVFSFVGLRTH